MASLARRMKAQRNPVAAHLHQYGSVHAQQCDGGAASGGQPDQRCPICAPGEMVTPCLKRRMKELRHRSIERVWCRLFGCLEAIADGAAQAQVVDVACTPGCQWHDMVDLESYPEQRF